MHIQWTLRRGEHERDVYGTINEKFKSKYVKAHNMPPTIVRHVRIVGPVRWLEADVERRHSCIVDMHGKLLTRGGTDKRIVLWIDDIRTRVIVDCQAKMVCVPDGSINI